MQVASIVPGGNFDLIADDTYHMALAHLVGDDPIYTAFYREQSDRGRFVLMDNGVVETGIPLGTRDLVRRAILIGASEIVLPDKIRDRRKTLKLSADALVLAQFLRATPTLFMSVPQGDTAEEWRACLEEMVAWPINSLGLSRFAPVEGWGFHSRLGFFLSRSLCPARQVGLALHLLGCGDELGEAGEIELNWPGWVRGTDSGVATMATAKGSLLRVGQSRVCGTLDLGVTLDPVLLAANLRVWRESCAPTGRIEEAKDA
jgi:hypothetical protein